MRTVPSLRLALLAAAALAGLAGPSPAEDGAAPHLARFAAGDGPRVEGGTLHLLDAAHTPRQLNAIAYDVAEAGAREGFALGCRLRVTEGGDGGSILFLNTEEYGARGPAPYLRSAVEPNLRRTLAVGIDVHNPPDEEMFSEWGNYQNLPQREISLHWDGREIVKRVAPAEFRGDFADCSVAVEQVCGGVDVTVKLGEGVVYDRFFVAGVQPYEARLAFVAGTRADATAEFDVERAQFFAGAPAAPRRPPLHVPVFHHVLTDNSRTSYDTTVDLPPQEWAFGRVILTLDIHDAGESWDEWDRNGEVSLWTPDGVKRGIVPFITSYRTACHWEVDVTHFRSWLSGKVRFEVAAGTNFYKNRGYEMSVSLDFHHGTPTVDGRPLEPYRVVPLWVGTAHYKSDENHFSDFFTPQEVAIDAETTAARIFTTTTGHSQVGEFTPSARAIVFRPDVAATEPADQVFPNVLWKADCYLNPNRPQYGTWKFSRAGWAPGDVVRPWWVDLTPFLVPGKTAAFQYEPQRYQFPPDEERPADEEIAQASHVVRSYLILYRDAAALAPAPTMRIVESVDGGAAAKAGIRSGDWLVTYDGRRIDSLDDLRAAISAAEAAGRATVKVVVCRGLENQEFELAPGRMGVRLGSQ